MGVIKGDTRSLDYSSFEQTGLLRLITYLAVHGDKSKRSPLLVLGAIHGPSLIRLNYLKFLMFLSVYINPSRPCKCAI